MKLDFSNLQFFFNPAVFIILILSCFVFISETGHKKQILFYVNIKEIPIKSVVFLLMLAMLPRNDV